MVSFDQAQALEYLINVPKTKQLASITMHPSSGKTKLALYYYHWLTQQGLKAGIYCFNKRQKYKAYAKVLGIKIASKKDLLGKLNALDRLDVLILDYSQVAQHTLYLNKDRAQQLLREYPKLRMVQIEQTTHNFASNNRFVLQQPLDNVVRTTWKIETLTSGGAFGRDKPRTWLEVFHEARENWFLANRKDPFCILYTGNAENAVLTICKELKIPYLSIRDQDALPTLETYTKLLLFLDASPARSYGGKNSLYEHMRYLFRRFAQNWKRNMSKSAVVVVPSYGQEMSFAVSLLLSPYEVEEFKIEEHGRKTNRLPASEYVGFSEPVTMSSLLTATYRKRLLNWPYDRLIIDASTVFEIEGMSKRVYNLVNDENTVTELELDALSMLFTPNAEESFWDTTWGVDPFPMEKYEENPELGVMLSDCYVEVDFTRHVPVSLTCEEKIEDLA